MAERVLKVKTVSEVAESIAGLTELGGSLKGVGTAAIEAAGKSKAEWVAFDAALKKTMPELKGISQAAFAAQSALNKMAGSTTASAIEKNMVAAKVAVNRYIDELDKARVAGAAIDDGFTASADVMLAAIAAMKKQLADMTEETGRARTELGLLGRAGAAAGDAVEDLAENAGKAGKEVGKAGEEIGKTGKAAAATGEQTVALGDKIRSSTERFNKFRGSALELWGALQLGQQIGEGVSRAIDLIAAKLAQKDEAERKAAAAAQAHQIAMKAVRDGLIEEGKTIDETVLNYAKATVALGKLDEGSRKFIEGIAGLKVPDALPDLAKQGEAMELSLRGAFARGTDAGKRFVLENQAALEQYRRDVESTGRVVSDGFKVMVDGTLQAARAAQSVPAALNAALPAIKTSVESYNELAIKVLEMAKAHDVTLPQLREVIEKEIARKDATGASFDAYSKLIEVIDRLHTAHKTIPEDIDQEISRRKALQDEIDKFTRESNERGVEREKQQAEEVNRVFEERAQRQREFIEEATRVEQQMNKWTDATQGAGKAFGALSGDFTSLNAEVAKFIAEGGNVNDLQVGMSIITLQIAQATERENAAFRERLTLMKAMREETEQALDAAKGWSDYITVATESFVNGGTSLQTFLKILGEFSTGLQQLYGPGGIGSVAEKRLKAMIDLLRDLMAAASSGQLKGGTAPTGLKGWLEEALGDGAGI